MGRLLERVIIEIDQLSDPDARAAAEPWQRECKLLLEVFRATGSPRRGG
jgi:hypothetical protein